MALQVITEEEIKLRRTSESLVRDIVVIVNPGCAGCAYWESLLEDIIPNYTSETDINTIRFSKLECDANNLPIFAPPVVPSIIALENGYRMFEALGAMNNTGPLEVMIDNWIAGNINIDTISGGESIVAM
jgi:hypothetical protein